MQNLNRINKFTAIPETTLAYMAGFVDGEGCISYDRDKDYYYPKVMVANTNLGIVEYFKATVGGTITAKQRDNPIWKIGYEWRLYHSNAIDFVAAIYPFLKIKERQAQALFAWDAIRPGHGAMTAAAAKENKEAMAVIIAELQWLNKRGTGEKGEEPIQTVLREMGGFEHAVASWQ